TVVATAGERDLARLAEAGAIGLDYRDPGIDDSIAAALPNGADVWLDTSGSLRLAQAVPLLAERGRIVLVAGVTRRDELPFGELYTHDRGIVGFAISNARVDELRRAADAVGSAVAADALPAPVVERRPLEQTAQAHADVEAGATNGRRLLIVP
ncbi:MAG: zinc-binding dehydrogenase, partial [Humibacter sp.]